MFDHLFASENPEADGDFMADLSLDSQLDKNQAKLEPGVLSAESGTVFQFERTGYFCLDPHAGDGPVIHRTAGLRDTWAKIAAKQKK